MTIPFKGYNRYYDFLNLEANKNMIFLNGDRNKKIHLILLKNQIIKLMIIIHWVVI